MLTFRDPIKRDKKGKFRVGDKVRPIHGTPWWEGTIIEDRGNIGHGGRRLYRISYPLELTDPIETEMGEDDLEAV